MRSLVVAGIGTDVGKTVVSAVLCQSLKADYWKPVVSGTSEGKVDDEIIHELLGEKTRVHPCGYRLSEPLSPHIAARIDGAEIDSANLSAPETRHRLVIELAGGVLVPLNDSQTNLDLLQQWQAPVVVVSRHYLGSINHTLLTLNVLQSKKLNVAGIVFVGEELPDTEAVITRLANVPTLGTLPMVDKVNSEAIIQLAQSGCLNTEPLLGLTS